MRTLKRYIPLVPLLGLVGVAGAQERNRDSRQDDERRTRTPRAFTYSMRDDDRPRLGISIGPSGRRDTLGVLVAEVTEDGPAAKAGIEEGDRIATVNGVNLRLSAGDAGEDDMDGVGARRLTRELGKLNPGDEVTLGVYRDGQLRSFKVKTVEADDLARSVTSTRLSRAEREERPSIGIGLGSSGSRRDTLGVLVSRVVDEGPADKANIEEGDRIAAVNGVDLRVAREDAGDFGASMLRIRRLNREMAKLKAGDEVELRLFRGGQPRTVRVRTIAARDLPERRGTSFFSGDLDGIGFDGMGFISPAIAPLPPEPPDVPDAPRPPRPPRAPRAFYFDRDGVADFDVRIPAEAYGEAMRRSADAMRRSADAMKRSFEMQRIRPRVRIEMDDMDAMSDAFQELKRALPPQLLSHRVSLD